MKKTSRSLFLSGLLLLSVEPWAASDEWQIRMLHEPSRAQLALEGKGRVFIYDGLTDAQVEQAMDQQFGRVGSMMFVRTVVTRGDEAGVSDPESGQLVIEDDGCD